jgi:hypothetical protein
MNPRITLVGDELMAGLDSPPTHTGPRTEWIGRAQQIIVDMKMLAVEPRAFAA